VSEMNEMNERTAAEQAKELYEHRHDPGEWSDEPVQIETRPVRSEVVSFRLPTPELTLLESAAGQAGESVSRFIRTAVNERVVRRATPWAMTITLAVWRSGPSETWFYPAPGWSTETGQFVNFGRTEPVLPGLEA
jgi:hypothetical protein